MHILNNGLTEDGKQLFKTPDIMMGNENATLSRLVHFSLETHKPGSIFFIKEGLVTCTSW